MKGKERCEMDKADKRGAEDARGQEVEELRAALADARKRLEYQSVFIQAQGRLIEEQRARLAREVPPGAVEAALRKLEEAREHLEWVRGNVDHFEIEEDFHAEEAVARCEFEMAEWDLQVAKARAADGAAHSSAELKNRDDRRRQNARNRARAQGGQKKDDDKALEALRKRLAAMALEAENRELTNEALIEKAVEVVNRNGPRLHCRWTSYRRLLPPSRKRPRKK